jgi:hypothetical protein
MIDKLIQNMERYAWLLLAGFVAFAGAAYVGSIINQANSDIEFIWLLTMWAMLAMGAVVVVLTVVHVLLDTLGTGNPIQKTMQLLKADQELLMASSLAFVVAARIGDLTMNAGSDRPEGWLAFIWVLIILGLVMIIGIAIDLTLDFLFTSFIRAGLERLREMQRLLLVSFVGAVVPAYVGSWTVDAASKTPEIWLATMWATLAVSAVILVSVVLYAVIETTKDNLLHKLVRTLQASRWMALVSFLAFAGSAYVGFLTVDADADLPAVWLAAMWIMLAVGALGIIAVVVQSALVVTGQVGVPPAE